MTDPATIPKDHHGLVWVFSLPPGLENPLRPLGQPIVDASGTEIVEIGALAGYGFARYLTEAAGFDPGQISADAARLDGLRGTVLLVFSKALGPGPARFAPGSGITLIGRYGTPPDQPDLTPLRSAAADGILEPRHKPPKSDARIGGMVAMAALAVLFLLFLFIIWVAG